MNNKGMAVSGIIYSVLLLLVLLILGIISVISTSALSLNKYKSNLISYLNGDVDKSAGFARYKEDILNGADPILDGGMIPVTIKNDGTVRKADLSEKWYSYENKQWANGVLIKEGMLDHYKNADIKTTINENDIAAYFVWIPRYKYFIPTGGTTTPSEINIVFEKSTTAKSSGNAVSTYLTHPGFTFGDEELNGIWVGKFETTGISNKPTILPNVTSLRNQNISEQFATAKLFQKYGVTRDSHMMKNTEWATAAYLSHSKYGINAEIRINNNNIYITGCGASSVNGESSSNCQIEYGSDQSNLPQSSTGNMTGVFDMSGGTWDRVMGNLNNTLGLSTFSKMPESKYYNLYETSSYLTACNGGVCLGHATTETKSWHSDYYLETNSSYPWVLRGGDYSHKLGAGNFYVNQTNGDASIYYSFRTVIS